MIGCYYRRLASDVFDPTDDTRSNWDPDIQHGSPPLALLTKAIEELTDGTGQRIGRATIDILGAVPVAPVRVRARVDRPGRRISVCVAEMLPEDSGDTARPVARVTAWLLATSDTTDVASDRYPALIEAAPQSLPHLFTGARGYLETVDWRPQQTPPGQAAVYWARSKSAVVDAEDDSPLIKLAAVADSANGVGATLDHTKFVYMNTDTVLHLHRLPVGADFALRAQASIGPDGVGLTTAEMFDRQGFIGSCAQTLFVQRH